MSKVTVKYLRGGKIVQMEKRYAEILVGLKMVRYHIDKDDDYIAKVIADDGYINKVVNAAPEVKEQKKRGLKPKGQ